MATRKDGSPQNLSEERSSDLRENDPLTDRNRPNTEEDQDTQNVSGAEEGDEDYDDEELSEGDFDIDEDDLDEEDVDETEEA
jgi:hypothetical protein